MKGLKITFNEFFFNFSKKILTIILLTVFISQCSSVLYQHTLLKIEKKNLEEVFENKMVIRVLPNPSYSQETTNNPDEIFSSLTETFGNELYYFNYSAPTSPQMLILEDIDKSKYEFFLNDDVAEISEDYMTLHALEVNELQYEKLKIKLASGENFQKKDFEIDTNVVILGNNYQDIYEIGEKITLSSDVKEFFGGSEEKGVKENYTVIGFLEKNESVFDFTQGKSEKLKLDDYILFPTSFTKITDRLTGIEVPVFLYAQGIYAIESKGYDLFFKRDSLNQSLIEKKLPMYFKIQDDNAVFVSKIKLLEEQLSGEIVRFFMLSIFLIVCLSSIISSQISSRGKYFIIYYLLGTTLKEIRWSYYFQLIIMYIISSFLYIVYILFFEELFSEMRELNLLSVVMNHSSIFLIYNILSVVIVWKSFRKLSTNHLSQLIKGEKL